MCRLTEHNSSEIARGVRFAVIGRMLAASGLPTATHMGYRLKALPQFLRRSFRAPAWMLSLHPTLIDYRPLHARGRLRQVVLQRMTM